MLDIYKSVDPRIGYYLAGFADSEGCFYVSFRPRNDYQFAWQISLCFNVSHKERLILALFKKHLGCGELKTGKDGFYSYEVSNFTAILDRVIPFFRKFAFLSQKKKNDFSKFQQIAEVIEKKEHLTLSGIERVLQLRQQLDRSNQKYSDEFILESIKKSSETTRQTDN